jgi:hypothetical protein
MAQTEDEITMYDAWQPLQSNTYASSQTTEYRPAEHLLHVNPSRESAPTTQKENPLCKVDFTLPQ